MPAGHLLVIEDSPTVLKVIELALSQAGYRVFAAPDEVAGLAMVREARTVPDLILLDGLLPNRDAAEICRRLAADAGLKQVPVVVMAARGQGDELEARFARASNVVDFIGKPFSPEALEAVVSHVVGRRTSSAASGWVTIPDAESRASAGVRAAVEEALTRAMVRQTSELAYEALRWRAGFFQFRRTQELPLLARDAALQVNVDRMLLEGFRRVDEWRIIEREISDFDEVFVRNDFKIG